MQKPGFWALCAAYTLDLVITQICGAIVGGILSFAVGFLAGAAGLITPDNMAMMMLLFSGIGVVSGFLIFIVYFALCESNWGSSLGKKLLKIHVAKNELV